MPYTQSGSISNIKEPTTNISVAVKEAIDLKNLVDDPKKLQTYDTHISPKEAYERLENGEKDECLINGIAKNPMYSYQYASYILKKPFLLGEPAIAKDAYYSYLYARGVLKVPFALGEPAIAKDAYYSYLYARGVLKVPFALGEPAIAKDAHYSFMYARDVLKGPFALGEKAIYYSVYRVGYEKHILKGRPWTGINKKKTNEAIDLKNLVSDPKKLQTHDTHIGPQEALRRLEKGDTDEYLVKAVSKDAFSAYVYAMDVLKGPFPLGEPAIAKRAQQSYLYAKYVLENPFPLGEPAIAEDAQHSYYYATDVLRGPFTLGEPAIYFFPIIRDAYEKTVLKGRPWTGLDQKVDEAIDLKKLVKNPNKLKTHKTHIGPKEAYDRVKKGQKDEYLIHAIAKDAKYSFLYAADILKKPFPLGEPAIAKNAEYSYQYAIDVLQGPFPLSEPSIATDEYYSYLYAMDVLKGPFPLGEPTIAKDPTYSFYYALSVIKGPWPPGESAIYNSRYKDKYEMEVLRGNPWTGLKKKKVKEAIDLKKLVSDPTKLKTVDTHISPEEALGKLKQGKTDKYLLDVIAKNARTAYEYAEYTKKRFLLGEPTLGKDPYHAFMYVTSVIKDKFPLFEPIIATYPAFAYQYAHLVLKGPFPLGEPAIATSPHYSFSYAVFATKKPFPLGEPAIATHCTLSYGYAKNVLKNRFVLGEPIISTSPLYAVRYAQNVIKGRFRIAEKTIYDSEFREQYKKTVLKDQEWPKFYKKLSEALDLKTLVSDPSKLKKVDTHISPEQALNNVIHGQKEYLPIVAKNPDTAYRYAISHIKGRFKLGEPAIAKKADTAYKYAHHVLNKRFKLGEPAIAEDGNYAMHYARYVLNKPFPLGEPTIAADAWDAAYYAREVLKGPFPLGEPIIATNAWASMNYAETIQKPFPLGEPSIATNPYYAYRYAKTVLKGRFYMAEPVLYKTRKWVRERYKEEILQGQPWNIPKKVKKSPSNNTEKQ